MNDSTSQLATHDIPNVKPVSLFWLLVPFALFFIANTLILLSIETQTIKELYYGSQLEWFKSLNQKLNTLPGLIWSNITQLGEAMVLLPIVFLCTYSKRKAWLAIMYSIPVASILSVGLKRLTSVPRPAAIIDHSEMTIIGKALIGYTSLPSGHTITIFAVSIAVLVSLYPSINKNKDKLILTAFLMLSMLISLSRVAVGAHWPLDLFVGAACGWLAGMSGAHIQARVATQLHKHRIWNFIFIGMFSILSVLLFFRAMNFSTDHLVILVSLICACSIVFKLLIQYLNHHQ